jgi:hypothetical protein
MFILTSSAYLYFFFVPLPLDYTLRLFASIYTVLQKRDMSFQTHLNDFCVHKYYYFLFLAAFRNVAKSGYYVHHVCLSVRMEHLGSY